MFSYETKALLVLLSTSFAVSLKHEVELVLPICAIKDLRSFSNAVMSLEHSYENGWNRHFGCAAAHHVELVKHRRLGMVALALASVFL